jgi:hypothetical protein
MLQLPQDADAKLQPCINVPLRAMHAICPDLENKILSPHPGGNHSFTGIVNHKTDDLRHGKDFLTVTGLKARFRKRKSGRRLGVTGNESIFGFNDVSREAEKRS